MRSFGRRVKQTEISKACPETSAFVPLHKISFQNIQVNFWQPAFRNSRAKEAAFLFAANCWFSHDVTKIQTKKPSILPRFYFHDALEQLKTNFPTNFRFKRVFGFVIEYA